jgi:hypothetical protein
MAISFRRAAPRASIMLATFREAMSKTTRIKDLMKLW